MKICVGVFGHRDEKSTWLLDKIEQVCVCAFVSVCVRARHEVK